MSCHLLEDEIKSSPTILLNSRMLATELLKIQVTMVQKAFMLSADVEGFHPNVPLSPIHDVVEHATTKHHGELKGQLARELCSIANNYLVFRYGSNLFWHTNGLAIEVASSPHIANLYAAKYEQHKQSLTHVLLYKR